MSRASAGGCAGHTGVTVIVDPHDGAGHARVLCDRDGGGETAWELFESNGVDLMSARAQPEFVCRVGGEPADDPCVQAPPADAYWSLWWTDGSGEWIYSSLSTAALTVPDGGAVAFSWDAEPGNLPPSADPRQTDAAGTPGPESSTEATGSAESAPPPDEPGADGLPGWVAPTVVVLLFLAAGLVLWRRRAGRAPEAR